MGPLLRPFRLEAARTLALMPAAQGVIQWPREGPNAAVLTESYQWPIQTGFLDRLDAFVSTMHPETVVVGGHESVTDLAAVRAQIEMSRACMAYVQGAFSEGLTIEQTAEQGSDRFPVAWIAFFYGYFAAQG